MSKNTIRVHVNLDLAGTLATVHISGRSNPIVATVLGVERNHTGEAQRIYLNALIHRSDFDSYEGWDISGAVSSILTRIPPSNTERDLH
jgi:hypothetical protein